MEENGIGGMAPGETSGSRKRKRRRKTNTRRRNGNSQWYKHPDEDTESSQTLRKPTELETPPPAQRPKIRPGQDLIRRREDTTQWTVYMPEVVMREVEYITSQEITQPG